MSDPVSLVAAGRVAAVTAAVLAGLGWLVGGATAADAHALLSSSVPADGATVAEAPAELLMTFSEALDPSLSVVGILDSSGELVGAGRAESVSGNRARVRVALGELPQGVYTATWRVTSPSDGHTTVGAVAFGVGVPAAPVGGDSGAEVQSPLPTVAAVAGRGLLYTGAVVLLGGAVVGLAVLSGPSAASRRMLVVAWAAAATGLGLIITDQLARTQATLADLLASTAGPKLILQVATLAGAGLAVGWAYRRPSRGALAAVGIAAAAVMLARALAGHANNSSTRWFTVGMQWLHLVSVGVWVGGLPWLLAGLRANDPGQGPGLARRFSSVATATLVVVVVSGSARAIHEVGAWSRLVDTDYGVTVLVKLGLFAALVGLAARSHFRHVATAVAGRLHGLRRAVRAEVAVAVAVLGATAMLTGFPPSSTVAAARGRTDTPLTVVGSDYATTVKVTLAVDPGGAGPNTFVTRVEDYDSGRAVAADSVSLRFQFAGRSDVAPSTLDLEPGPDSRWRGSGSVLSIAGRWAVTALVQTPTDAVEVPMELTTRSPAPASSGGSSRCGIGEQDPAYIVAVRPDPEPARAEGTTFRLDIQRAGRPVSGATVCLKLDMPEMQHPGVSAPGTESASGSYAVPLRFSMPGVWSGSVTVAPPGGKPVIVPVRVEVR